MNMLIKNGTVITDKGRRAADVAVKDGRIEAVWDRCGVLPEQLRGCEYDETVDAAGLYVLPGAIDAHTHFELGFGGEFSSADDFYTGTRAAACGGVTTVIDFVTPEPGESLTEALNKRRAAAGSKVCIDYGLHMSIVEVSEHTLAEMNDVVNAGISSFKTFMTYAFMLSDDEFVRTFARCRELGALAMVHAEAHDEIEALKAQFIAQGKTDAWHHYLSRPENTETEGVRQAIELYKRSGIGEGACAADLSDTAGAAGAADAADVADAASAADAAGAALYIVHLASGGGVDAVRAALHEGYKIYAETCPQYLHFTNDAYKRPDGINFICSPPMKGKASRGALWQAISDGTIRTVATDHCPFTLKNKARGKDDFTKVPNGVMGTEIMYPYMLSAANEGRISFERAAGLCCANPAKIFRLDRRKGSIAPGLDADIVLYDPCKDYAFSQSVSHSAADYTIWEGVSLKGCPVSVYSHGRLVYKDGDFLGRQGDGRFISR